MPRPASSNSSTPPAAAQRFKYLIFRHGGEEHGVPLLSVREVSSQRSVRPALNMAPHFVRVTNLPGSVISMVSLERPLSSDEAPSGEGRVMLVVGLGDSTLAVLADVVVAVRAIDPADIDETPRTEPSTVAKHLRGRSPGPRPHFRAQHTRYPRIRTQDLETA